MEIDIKILHIISSLDVGGAERTLQKLITNKIDLFSHSVISLSNEGFIGKELRSKGIRVISLNMKHFYHAPIAFWHLIKIIRLEKPDIVHTWMYHGDLLGGLAAKIVGHKKIIWAIRNTHILPSQGISRSTAIVMKICSFLSRFIPHTIICVAESAKDSHIKYGYFEKKLKVIPNGFETVRYKYKKERRIYWRKHLNIPIDAKVIGSIGRFNEYKDHATFIAAAGDIIRLDPNIFILMAGSDVDNKNQKLVSLIDHTNKQKNFRLIGEQKNVFDIFASLDIFCLHSLSEGFPNVLGEAMSFGLPVISTDVGDSRLIVSNENLIVAPSNKKELVKGLTKLIKLDARELKALGRLSRNRIKSVYSLKASLEIYKDLYLMVAKS